MTAFTGFYANPIPAQPSEESRRVLRKLRHNRKLAGLLRPRGIRLRLMRSLGEKVLRIRVPEGTAVRKVTYGVPGLLAIGAGADPASGVLLWIHGGGLVGGSPELELGLAARYSALSGLQAFLPRLRLAPENPFPAAPDDVLAAYRGLLDAGFPAESIRLGGGSAGGYLILGLLGDIAREGLPMPAGALLLSPIVDITGETAGRRDAERPDPLFPAKNFAWTIEAYAPGMPLDQPRLNVLDADTGAWPPILVQTGGTECLGADAELLGETLRGRRCEVQIWPGQVHGFQLVGADGIPEAKAALEYGGRFLADL